MDDELDRLLRTGTRPVPTGDDARSLSDDVWVRIRLGVADDTPADAPADRRLVARDELAARRRRRPARVASITLAVVLAGAGTAAAADYLSTRTGEELTGWEQDAGGRGEVLNPAGTDRAEVFDQVTGDIQFPPGYESARQYVLDFYPAEADSRVTEGVLRSNVARAAVCSWADSWVAAEDAGDAVALSAATAVLTGAPAWPDIVANDFPNAEYQPDGNGRSYNGWVPPLAAAASAGDRQALLDEVAGSYACSHEVIPVIDADPDYPMAGVR
ncbi:hypothetical protein TEK04_17740 [Klenkia sp. LSe6-5]|uniref:PknH-like extracellular domain-containing protein n=1 Tax=Klenkia sesuvii TaxID=3103137 RepID=A0ABU8DY50_9ACTN